MSHHLLRSRFFPLLSFVISLTTYLLNAFTSWFALFHSTPLCANAWHQTEPCDSIEKCAVIGVWKNHIIILPSGITYYSMKLIKAICCSFEPHSCNKYIPRIILKFYQTYFSTCNCSSAWGLVFVLEPALHCYWKFWSIHNLIVTVASWQWLMHFNMVTAPFVPFKINP